jgi:hypothetical protein
VPRCFALAGVCRPAAIGPLPEMSSVDYSTDESEALLRHPQLAVPVMKLCWLKRFETRRTEQSAGLEC